MSEQMLSGIRTALKLASGFLMAKGIGDESTWEVVIGGVIGVVSMIASYKAHK